MLPVVSKSLFLHANIFSPLPLPKECCVRTVLVQSATGFHISMRKNDIVKKWQLSDTAFVCTAHNNRLYIGKKMIAGCELDILPQKNGKLRINGIDTLHTVHLNAYNHSVKVTSFAHSNSSEQKIFQTYVIDTLSDTLSAMMNTIASITHKRKNQVIQSIKMPRVKVLLDQIDMKSGGKLVLATEHGFKIKPSEDNLFRIRACKELALSVHAGHMYINGKRVVSSCWEVAAYAHERIMFNNKAYDGSFIITVADNKVLLINSIDLENYTYAVTRSEGWPGWPLEVNKVLAIASRSYVMAMMARAEKNKQLYHVKDTNAHQRYNLYGEHENPIVRQAVLQTQGVCLMHNDQPILAMFDGCCGGIIPAHIADFDFKTAPYLARKYACTFCKSAPNYSWQTSFDFSFFEQMLKKQGITISGLQQIKVHKKDKAGVVQEVFIKGKSGQKVLTGKKIYALSKDIKSFAYTINHRANKVHIKGSGGGHHLGLCQWGVKKMVDEGWNFSKILQFYYPDTSIKKIFCA